MGEVRGWSGIREGLLCEPANLANREPQVGSRRGRERLHAKHLRQISLLNAQLFAQLPGIGIPPIKGHFTKAIHLPRQTCRQRIGERFSQTRIDVAVGDTVECPATTRASLRNRLPKFNRTRGQKKIVSPTRKLQVDDLSGRRRECFHTPRNPQTTDQRRNQRTHKHAST